MAYETTDAYETLTPGADDSASVDAPVCAPAAFPESVADGTTCRKCGHVGAPVGRGQCAKCRSWVKRNGGAITHGLYRADAAEALAPVLADRRRAILRQLGHTERDCPPIMSDVVDSLIESRLIAASFFAYLTQKSEGDVSRLSVTTRGRVSRAAESHGKATDRVAKLAQLLGLGRRARSARRRGALAGLQRALEGTDDA